MIFAINDQSEKPDYSYQLKMGATSLTEAWNAGRYASQDHFMLGQIQEWFYHDLAGIQDAPGSAGFKQIVIAPQPVGNVTRVKASYDSVLGPIVSQWSRKKNWLTMRVQIPANTTAIIQVPSRDARTIRESGRPAASSPHVEFLRIEGKCAVFRVGSGTYTFKAQIL